MIRIAALVVALAASTALAADTGSKADLYNGVFQKLAVDPENTSALTDLADGKA